MKKLRLLVAPLLALSFFNSGCSNDGFRQITFDEFLNYLDKCNIDEANEGALKVRVSCKFNSSEIYDPEAEVQGNDYYSDFINESLLYNEFSGAYYAPKFTIDHSHPVEEGEFDYADTGPFWGVKVWREILVEAMHDEHQDLFKDDYYFNDKNNILAIRTKKTIIYEFNNARVTSGNTHTSMYFDLNRKCITHIEATIDKIKFNVYSDGEEAKIIYTSPKSFSGHILLDWFDFAPFEKM